MTWIFFFVFHFHFSASCYSLEDSTARTMQNFLFSSVIFFLAWWKDATSEWWFNLRGKFAFHFAELSMNVGSFHAFWVCPESVAMWQMKRREEKTASFPRSLCVCVEKDEHLPFLRPFCAQLLNQFIHSLRRGRSFKWARKNFLNSDGGGVRRTTPAGY